MTKMLSMQNVTKIYPGSKDVKAVDNLSFSLDDGEICTLVGPSGCGKTTCMKMINRLIPMTSGEILINGKNINQLDVIDLRRDIGYVIQHIGLFPNMTIAENISVIPRMKKWPADQIFDRVQTLLELVNLPPGEFMDRYPAELSGGQQQRIGVARAMAADPPIMLMDEPFGAIDPINREHLQDEFLKIQEQIKKTIIFVTHDIDEAIKMGDKICLMNEGKLIQFDSPENLLTKPVNDFAADFVGSDRALKRLSLRHVRDAMHSDVPAINANKSVDTAKAIMKTCHKDHLIVVNDDNRFMGYVSLEILNSTKGLLTENITLTRAVLQMNTSLKDALSLIYTFNKLDEIAVVDETHQLKGALNDMDIKFTLKSTP